MKSPVSQKAQNETTLYILMIPSHTPKGNRENLFISDYQKRNLLLRYIVIGAPTPNTLNKEVSMDKNDDSRLEEFRQLKREIRGSTQQDVGSIGGRSSVHSVYPSGFLILVPRAGKAISDYGQETAQSNLG
jgi:hypothetical protein